MMAKSKRWLLGFACVGLFTWAGQGAQAVVLVRSHDQVVRYSDTGEYLDVFIDAGGLWQFGDDAVLMPQGDLLIKKSGNEIVRYAGPASTSAAPGTFLGVFASRPSGQSGNFHGLTFGPDGYLYITIGSPPRILRFDGTTGDYVDTFVSGTNLNFAVGITVGPDDMLYVANRWGDNVARFDPYAGPLGLFVPVGSGGLSGATNLSFMSTGTLLVSSKTQGHPRQGPSPPSRGFLRQ